MLRTGPTLLAVMLSLATFPGCGEKNVNETTYKIWTPLRANFPELDQIASYSETEGNQQVEKMSHRKFFHDYLDINNSTPATARLNTKVALEQIKEASFQARLKALDEATLPPEFASAERDESRKKYVAEWKILEGLLASNGKTADIIASTRKLQRYMLQMYFIPGQTPPTGDAAKGYASVEAYIDPYKE